MPTQLIWSAMIRSLSFDRQSAERLKTESPIFCLAQLDIGTPHETRFSSNLFKLLNACSKLYFFLARISWVKWFVLDIFVLFPFISIQLSFALSHFISFQGKTGQMLNKLWNSQYESRSKMNGSMIRNGSWASVGFFLKGLELRISARFAWAGLYCCSSSSLCVSGHYEKDQHMKYLALEKIYAI